MQCFQYCGMNLFANLLTGQHTAIASVPMCWHELEQAAYFMPLQRWSTNEQQWHLAWRRPRLIVNAVYNRSSMLYKLAVWLRWWLSCMAHRRSEATSNH